MPWSGKTVLVTGGNSGIGKGITERFLNGNARIVIVGRDEAKGLAAMESLRENTGGVVEFHACDLADEPAVKQLASDVAKAHGAVDILVNNAGAGGRRCGVEPDDDPGVRWKKLRGPNLDSTYFMTAWLAPHLTDATGTVVNISSTATLHGNWGLYGAAKAGVEGLTRSFAAELAPRGIRVNAVSPGWILNETVDLAYVSGSEDGTFEMPPSLFNRMGDVSEIASVVVFLASGQASFMTGQTIVVDGGLSIVEYPSIQVLEKSGGRLFSRETTGK